jgi:beta-galactosidase
VNQENRPRDSTLRTPKAGRYLKFVAKSEVNGNAWTSAAEISIQAQPESSGIHAVTVTPAAASTICYNLQGRRMTGSADSWPSGIYIRQGRKVVVK